MGAVNPAGPDEISPPEPIKEHHRTAKFDCGKPALDDWLKDRALKSEGRSARTYVVCAGDEVVGYYCLATASVRLDELPKKLKGDMPSVVPVILIGRLAVSLGHQGLGIGSGLLRDALSRSLQVSSEVGCRAVMVHAIDESAAAFYSGYGFVQFPESSRTFFMAMKTIAGAL